MHNIPDPITDEIQRRGTSAGMYFYDGELWQPIRMHYQETFGVNSDTSGTAIDMSASPCNMYTMSVHRIAGSTDTVLIAFGFSMDGTNWQTAGTGISETNQYLAGAGVAVTSFAFNNPALAVCKTGFWRYVRWTTATVGTGNTVNIRLLAGRS